MHPRIIFSAAVIALTANLGTVQAAERFATLGDVPSVKMTSTETKEVRGGDHVIRMLGRIGVTVQSAANSGLNIAGSGNTPARDMGVSNDIPTINGLF